MARFSYVSIDLKGKTLSGEISATDLKDARVKIKQKGLTPLQIKPLGGLGREKEKSKPSKPFRSKEKILSETNKGVRGKGEKIGLEFLKRLLELHSIGMPVADVVKLLNQRLSDPGQKEIA